MTVTTMNAKPRKSLASQLDRLDGILDALSIGLNEAVATAVQQAVSVALKEALTEILTNAELQRLLHPPTPQPPAPPPSTPPSVNTEGRGGWLAGLWQSVAGGAAKAAAAAWSGATTVVRKAGELVATGVQKVRRGACNVYGWLLSHRLAAVVGMASLAAVAFHVVGPAVAATVGGLAVPALLLDLPGSLLSLFGGT